MQARLGALTKPLPRLVKKRLRGPASDREKPWDAEELIFVFGVFGGFCLSGFIKTAWVCVGFHVSCSFLCDFVPFVFTFLS